MEGKELYKKLGRLKEFDTIRLTPLGAYGAHDYTQGACVFFSLDIQDEITLPDPARLVGILKELATDNAGISLYVKPEYLLIVAGGFSCKIKKAYDYGVIFETPKLEKVGQVPASVIFQATRKRVHKAKEWETFTRITVKDGALTWTQTNRKEVIRQKFEIDASESFDLNVNADKLKALIKKDHKDQPVSFYRGENGICGFEIDGLTYYEQLDQNMPDVESFLSQAHTLTGTFQANFGKVFVDKNVDEITINFDDHTITHTDPQAGQSVFSFESAANLRGVLKVGKFLFDRLKGVDSSIDVLDGGRAVRVQDKGLLYYGCTLKDSATFPAATEQQPAPQPQESATIEHAGRTFARKTSDFFVYVPDLRRYVKITPERVEDGFFVAPVVRVRGKEIYFDRREVCRYDELTGVPCFVATELYSPRFRRVA